MRSKRLLLLSAIALGLSIGFSQNAQACVCDGDQSFHEAFKQADAIFAATYVGGEYRSGIKDEFAEMRRGWGEKVDGYQVLVLKFAVKTWWKGAGTSEVIIVTEQTKNPDGT